MRQETPVIDAAQISTSGKRGGDRPLKLLLPLVRPYWKHLAGGVAGLIVSSAMMLAMGWGLKQIVDLGFADPSGGFLNKSLLVLLLIITVMAVASYARMQLVYRVAERVTADLRKKIYKHLLTLDPGWFENNKTGDQVSKINADTTVLQVIITSNLPSAFRHFLMLLGGVVMLMLVSPVMTGMVVLVVPLLILPMIYFGRHVRRKSRETQSSVGEISSYTHETVQGIQTIQSFGYEGTAQSRFDALADNTYAQALKYIRLRALLTALILSLVFGAIGVVLWAGGHKVLAGEITGGELSAFIFYCAMVAGSVTSISEAMGDFSRASGAADRISALLAATPSVKSGSTVLPARPEGKIVFDHVTFSYPSRPESKALDEATFSAQAGEVVALVGPSGAGKSTVFHLLQRFYDSAAGHITIDGRDITACDPREVRRVLGVVAQDPVIFSSSIADNIRLGRPDATDDEVLRAAELAQADEFITALPQGYHTLVGERGNRLSGGQRQRIAIARALLKDPAILLLDEATSALDASNELAVHVALRNLMKGRTTLIIAHRLSTVQGADKIIVLDHGRVVGAGTHQDLYGHNSLYTHLAGLQMDLKAVS